MSIPKSLSLKKYDEYDDSDDYDDSKIIFSPERTKILNNIRYYGLIEYDKICTNQKNAEEQSRIAKDGITEIAKINKEI